MTYREELRAEPFRFDLLAALREFERTVTSKPRIGNSTMVSDEIVDLWQPPFLDFPASNVGEYSEREDGLPRISARFLGFFGPQGALPLQTTVDTYHWSQSQDRSFADFTNIFASRFLQLFFRAWADARPIAQHDRPDEDRFLVFIASLAGIGSDAFRNRDSVEDLAKAGFAGLTSSPVKSAARLRRLIRGIFKVEVDIEERVGSWLSFEPGDCMALGQAGSALGADSFVGTRAYSINDKFRVKIEARNIAEYKKFLPSGDLSARLTDLIFFYVGHRFEFDVELSLPAREATAVQLGRSGELGWTAWMAPDTNVDESVRLRDARFNTMERKRLAAREKPTRKPTQRSRKS